MRRSRVILVVVAGLVVVAVLSIAVGFVGPGPEATHIDVLPGGRVSIERLGHGGFNWELAALFGTALGTTLLALATGALAYSTWQDVRASQRLAAAATQQLEVSREANELTRSEQSERLRPAVIAAVEGVGSTFKRTPTESSGLLAVALHNVGGGPAVRIEVGAVYTADPLVARSIEVQSRTVPALPPNGTFPIALSFSGPRAGSVNFNAFRVVGRYFDRLDNPAGEIIDWKHTTVEPPAAKATASAPPPSVRITGDEPEAT